jgi:hypothetical protein
MKKEGCTLYAFVVRVMQTFFLHTIRFRYGTSVGRSSSDRAQLRQLDNGRQQTYSTLPTSQRCRSQLKRYRLKQCIHVLGNKASFSKKGIALIESDVVTDDFNFAFKSKIKTDIKQIISAIM